MTALLLLWLGLAWADTPGASQPVEAPVPAEPPASRSDPDGDSVHEIWVFGELMVDQAREELIEDLEAQGYTEVKDKGDYLLLRHPSPYMGEMRIYDDGWVRMKRQPVRLEAPEVPWAKKNSAGAWATCVLYPPACLKTGGQLVSQRRWYGVQARAIGATEDTIEVYADRVADYRTEETVNELPERLEALWEQGVPLDDGPVLETREARREAVLRYWQSRTDTVWGDRVRLAVEAFLRAEVQTSEWALTDDEITAFNERRTCERRLDLRRPWDEVMAEVVAPY